MNKYRLRDTENINVEIIAESKAEAAELFVNRFFMRSSY